MNTDETLKKILDPMDTSTGGGSASALAGGMAGSLVDMVCRLAVKDESESTRIMLDEKSKIAAALSEFLLIGADEDRAAFQGVRDAFKLPKETEEQKSIRSRAIQAAWQKAARVPLENAEKCIELAELVGTLNGKTNPNAQSDLLCAYFLARAGCLGCLENVSINLPSIKDQESAMDLQSSAYSVRKRLETLTDPSKS